MLPLAIRYLPLCAVVAYIGGLFAGGAVLHARTFGRCPLNVPRSDDVSVHAFVSRMLVLFFVALTALGALAAFAPGWLDAVDPLYAARSPLLLAAGGAMMAVAAALVWRAQREMAASWRVGIEPGERTPLVTGGLFRFCRNPIYLGLQLGLAGFCLLVPGYLTLMLFAVAAVLFQVQARLEEAHLLGLHGEPYARYCRDTGRFLPWSGRWPAT